MTLENAPDWRRELREISAGSYELVLKDATGRVRYSATGSDPVALTKDAEDWLSRISGKAQSTRP